MEDKTCVCIALPLQRAREKIEQQLVQRGIYPQCVRPQQNAPLVHLVADELAYYAALDYSVVLICPDGMRQVLVRAFECGDHPTDELVREICALFAKQRQAHGTIIPMPRFVSVIDNTECVRIANEAHDHLNELSGALKEVP